MEQYNLENEKNKHPYNVYGSVFEEEHNNARFLMRNALKYVIDEYDEYLGSVEISHYEKLGYNEVVDFIMPEGETTLDLTWMNKDDVFVLNNSSQYQNIDTICVNIDNLGFSYLPSNKNENVCMNINGANASSSFVHQIKAFKDFVTKNNSISIKLDGFSPLAERVLHAYAQKCGVLVEEVELNNNNRHM